MRSKTAITWAMKLCYQAYAEHARVVDNVLVKPLTPDVRWKAPDTWIINGEPLKITAREIIDRYDQCQREWNQRIREAMKAPEDVLFGAELDEEHG